MKKKERVKESGQELMRLPGLRSWLERHEFDSSPGLSVGYYTHPGIYRQQVLTLSKKIMEQNIVSSTKLLRITFSSADHSILQLISTQFDGTNYLKWRRAMTMAYSCKRPAKTNPTYHDWERTNYTVLCWLIRSMQSSISDGLLYVTSSQQLLTELEERYNQSNAPHLYQLRKNMMQITQGDSSIAEYYANLRSAWEDLLSLDPLPDCNPLPSVNQAYYRLQQVEMQKRIVNIESPSDSEVALLVQKTSPTQGETARSNFKRSRPSCDYCGKPGHIKSTCYKLKRDSYKKDFRSNLSGSDGRKFDSENDTHRFAAHVEDAGGSAAEDTPLDTSLSVQTDPALVQAVMKEVLKAM
ncbi:hypothetical protein RND81_01G220700 [Saponaria officinalis]|uniref:CCHC-type domain-containing protein n=1 Tax=Saponaria officinalis TaxID=3572 RepID=A0AAW1NHM6_SAPOF